MKKNLLASSLLSLTVLLSTADVQAQMWQKQQNTTASGTASIKPEKYLVFSLREDYLKELLFRLPSNPQNAKEISLPDPTGELRTFKVWETPVMDSRLAARYPEIKTLTAYASDNRFVTAKIDVTSRGFHAVVFDGENSYFIDPASDNNDGSYLCYFKRDYIPQTADRMICQVDANGHTEEPQRNAIQLQQEQLPKNVYKTNGTTHRTFRLALACTGEYATAVGGATATKASVLGAMVTTINRVNGVYERELAVSLQLIGNTDTLIFLDGTTDPYSNGSGPAMLGENQLTVDNYIGTANYDIGHVFSTGGGGIAALGSVCGGSKARGVTGSPRPTGDPFDIDYVSHEIGHQFGGEHTFNANTGSCTSNGSTSSSYEPGSGSTIMAYAGICGAGDNLQTNSDAYFHAQSLSQMSNFITSSRGSCASVAVSGNTPSVVPPIAQTYYIPFKTPFELTAPQPVDVANDQLTYCWEQWNLGDFGRSWSQTKANGPIFRSLTPDTSATRIFPRLSRLLVNSTSYLGEKLPDTARNMSFVLTVRDIYNGMGCFNTSEDAIDITVVNTGNPFAVLTPTMSTSHWTAASTATVAWSVSGTEQAPINCRNVDIYLSIDGGYTYPYLLASQTANDGSETITVPDIVTTKARVKVKGSGNVFFDISNSNFTIDNTASLGVNTYEWAKKVKFYPVPATDYLNVETEDNNVNMAVYNATGLKVFEQSNLSAQTRIPVSEWARGVYFIKMSNSNNGETHVEPVTIN